MASVAAGRPAVVEPAPSEAGNLTGAEAAWPRPARVEPVGGERV